MILFLQILTAFTLKTLIWVKNSKLFNQLDLFNKNAMDYFINGRKVSILGVVYS